MKNLFLNFIGISLAVTTLISCGSGSEGGDNELYNNAIKKMQEVIKNDKLNGREPKYELDLNGDGIKEEFIKVDWVNYALFTKVNGSWKSISSENIEIPPMSTAPEKLSTSSDGWNDFLIESIVVDNKVYKWDGSKYILTEETVIIDTSNEGEYDGEADIAEYKESLASTHLEGEWYEPKTETSISVNVTMEEGIKGYLWDEKYDGAVESMVCIFTNKCTDDRDVENDDEGAFMIIFNKDVVLCYKAEIKKMDNGSVQLIMTDETNNTVRTLNKK